MNKVISLVTSVLFVGCIIIFGLISLISADRLTSEVENRNLAQRPDLNTATIISGQYFKDYENYFSDQLFRRDYLIKSFTMLQLKMNKTVINNTVLAEDGWILGMPLKNANKRELSKSSDQVNKLANFLLHRQADLFIALAPHKSNILMNHYPSFMWESYGGKNRDYFINQLNHEVEYINLFGEFADLYNADEIEEMYFRTDHHWNSKGAYNAYQIIKSRLIDIAGKGLDNSLVKYEVKCNNNSKFIGSYNRKLFGLQDSSAEYSCSYFPSEQSDLKKFQATDSRGNVFNKLSEVYSAGIDKNELTYIGISSRDYAEILFEYENKSEKKLLILKDSYGNPIVPFLAQHFQKTFVLDLRHYKEMNVYQYIENNDIDVVLILYNDANLLGEMYEF